MGVSEFKASCLGIMREFEKGSGTRVIVTKRGRDIATVAPKARRRKSSFGCLRGKIKTKGDIVYFDTADLWEATKRGSCSTPTSSSGGYREIAVLAGSRSAPCSVVTREARRSESQRSPLGK
jgi:antitoxin (DNA-binding transcriptional repressor) of toxin-antitoxin stability system